VGYACTSKHEEKQAGFESKRGSRGSHFNRTTNPPKYRFRLIESGRKAPAFRSRFSPWQIGRQQRRQSARCKFIGGQKSGNRTTRRNSTLGKAVTTIVALAARDFVVVGCDSLATTSADLAFPAEITSTFFEANGELKKDANGVPLLKTSGQIWEKAQSMPVDQLPSVTKLYDLEPMRACLLFAGASRIGNTTIWNLVETFKGQQDIAHHADAYDMKWLAETLAAFIQGVYTAEIPEVWMRPTMEIILSGYSADFREPELWRLTLSYDRVSTEFKCDIQNTVERGKFNVIFGGQYDVIQRVVNGIDWPSYCSLRQRTVDALSQYHDEMQAQVYAVNANLAIAKPNFYDKKYSIFGDDQGGVTRIFSDVGRLSEQAGIDFVYFLIDVMIKAQEFSSSIATVGGRIHVALLTKSKAFRWISKEGFTFEREHVPKFQNA
jgi:hypothetical protein